MCCTDNNKKKAITFLSQVQGIWAFYRCSQDTWVFQCKSLLLYNNRINNFVFVETETKIHIIEWSDIIYRHFRVDH